ncbi:MAG TPA: glycogen debranching N-terminal domain-containing protein [Thermoanaerobaculia bacterium]|nr:glycogen debranching N-terminal domain-containing protein [Thermoanaerobaculia bacterium]
MLTRIRARPTTLYISHGRTVLATGRDGMIAPGSTNGLFVYETRLIRTLRYFIDDALPAPNVLSNVEQHSFLGYYLAAAPGVDAGDADRGSGMVPPESRQPLELRVSRFAGDGLHEDIDLTNFAKSATRFTFAIEIEDDCSDLADLDHRVEIDRHVDIGFSRAPRVEDRQSCLSGQTGLSVLHQFEIELEPHASWHLCIDFAPSIDGNRMRPCHRCRSFDVTNERQRAFLGEAAKIETRESGTLANVVASTLEQAKRDLAALRLYDLDSGPRAWTFAAGLPLYIALFGRDTLTASWQAALLGCEMMSGTLDALAKLQGTRIDDWRDEQPGRMLHEAHTGPLSALDINNRGRSYGSITTSGLYAFMVAELWHWTGDVDAVRPFVDPALRALDWLDRDRLHNGLYSYETRSRDGVKHQAWKDSPDAIVYEDGSPVEPPIATCEEQGFVHIAKLHFAEVLWALGRRDEAKRLFEETLALKRRFSEAFWMPEEGFYALAIDANGRQVKSITSNAGHCIATAIADETHVPLVVERLFAPDMFSGWGIRTLSSKHPSYNPYSYHLGSIWPVEHGTFAFGFMRYGLHDRVQQLARAQFEAAALFDFYRLPELFSGHPRDADHPFPSLYPNANSPQAWSASATFSLLQAMLGLYPYAPLHLLVVDPHLPEWLPEITIRDLRVGAARVTIRFHGTSWDVLEKEGTLHVVQQPLPWSLTATWPERVVDLMRSLVK